LKNTYICPSCKKEFDWDDALEETMIRCPLCRTEMMAPGPLLPKGSVVGDYLVKERIGIGGMGEVYLAGQRSMDNRPVAVKILHEDLIKDQAYLERFYREVRILAQIEHPNVVSAIEAGKDGNVYYFAMTFIDGKDIKRMLDEGHRFTEHEALRITCEIAYALKYAWEKHGILHRDIKPANIMLTGENEVKLMDLGISKKVSGEDVELTMAGMMVGSPQYVSPEQAKALKDMDFRADMYSLGASLYHMLTGSPPYPGENAMEVLARHLDEPVPDPRKLRPSVSQKTVELIAIMMAKRKEDRFEKWDDCIGEIKDIMDELGEDGKGSASVKTGRTAVQMPVPETVKPVRKKAKGGFPVSKKMLKVAIYIILFIVCLSGFGFVVKKSMLDSRKDQARHLLDEAVKFIEANPEPANFRKALVMLENVQKAGDPEFSAEAKVEMDKILDKAQKIRNKKLQDQKRAALEVLKKQSYEFEKIGDLDKAVSTWENYAGNGPYAKDFEFEIKKAMEYLNRKKKVKEDGVD